MAHVSRVLTPEEARRLREQATRRAQTPTTNPRTSRPRSLPSGNTSYRPTSRPVR